MKGCSHLCKWVGVAKDPSPDDFPESVHPLLHRFAAPLSLSTLFFSPSHFLSSFPPCVEGLLPVLFSGWKGYSSLLDILLGCEYTSTNLHLVQEKEKGEGGVKEKKNT